MQITTEESDNLLKIAGTLGIGVAGELRQALADFVLKTSAPAHESLVDLSQVDGCDAAALQLLCSAQKTAARLGKPLRLTGAPAAVLKTSAALGWTLPEAGLSQRDEDAN